LLYNLEVECLLFLLMGFPIVGWDYKIKIVVLCCLSVNEGRKSSFVHTLYIIHPIWIEFGKRNARKYLLDAREFCEDPHLLCCLIDIRGKDLNIRQVNICGPAELDAGNAVVFFRE